MTRFQPDDARFLRWCHERFAVVFHESPNLDWMQRLAQIADRAEARSQREPELRVIQRYTLAPDDDDGSLYLELDPDGRWCLFDDVPAQREPELEALRKALTVALSVVLHERHDPSCSGEPPWSDTEAVANAVMGMPIVLAALSVES